MARTRSSVRSAGGSKVWNVRMQVRHMESQRLVASRYSERGSASTTAGRHAEAMSERRDHRGTGAADLRQVAAAGALPVEGDAVAARERAVRIGVVGPTGQRATTGAAAATRTIGAGGRRSTRGDELVRLDDGRAGAFQIGERQAAAGPV